MPPSRSKRDTLDSSDGRRQAERDRNLVVRGILTGFELAKAQHNTVLVDLPFGWVLEATCKANDELEEADTIGSTNGGVASRLSFTVHLPNGSEIRSWSRLSVALQQLHKTNTPEANPHTHADDDAGRRQSSRKRMRPLEYWANERVLYDSGEVVGAISGDTLLAFE